MKNKITTDLLGALCVVTINGLKMDGTVRAAFVDDGHVKLLVQTKDQTLSSVYAETQVKMETDYRGALLRERKAVR